MFTESQPVQRVSMRLAYIDALRGLAALMVLFCHSLQIDANLELPSTLTQILVSCKYGVQLFFVISAFTIFYSLGGSDASVKNFFIRRFFRIAPLYFIAVLAYSLLYENEDFTSIVLNLTFLHGFSPTAINSVVPGGWSIGVEMVFYCMAPFIFKKIYNLERALYFLIITLLFSFAIIYVYRKAVTSSAELESFVYFWLPSQLPIFGLGFVVYLLSGSTTTNRIGKLYYPLAVLCFMVLAGTLTKLSLIGEPFLFAAAATVLIILFSKKPFPGLVNKFTLYLGKVSYSLYLSQYAAIFILQKSGFYSVLASKTTFGSMVNIAFNIVVLLMVTGVLATVFYHAIELPFQKLGKKLIVRKSSPVTEIQSVKIQTAGEKPNKSAWY